MSKGMCQTCFQWGELATTKDGFQLWDCWDCKDKHDAKQRALRNDRTNKESVRPLYRRDSGG